MDNVRAEFLRWLENHQRFLSDIELSQRNAELLFGSMYQAGYAAAEAKYEELVRAMKRLLIEFDFLIESGALPDIRNDIIFVKARDSLAALNQLPKEDSAEHINQCINVIEREELAEWMMANSFSTGHGDTIEDLLKELYSQDRWPANEAKVK